MSRETDHSPEGPTLTIRRYQTSDREAVWTLHTVALDQVGTNLGPGPWDDDLSRIEATYLNTGGDFVVGEVKGQIVAMGALRRVSKECAEIKRMRVDPGFQGQGFGRAILQHLERRAAELGYRKLCLDTTTQQKAAQHLYQSHGFKETGRSTIGRFDLILFEKMLPTAQADATHSDGSETQ